MGTRRLLVDNVFRQRLLRTMDILLASVGVTLAGPIMVVLALIGLFDTGSPIFCQIRVGRQRRPFLLIKFRTMRVDAASVATHLADPAVVTGYGKLLRRTKLDELPQLWNVLKGDMSMVGPRPCLFSQEELIEARVRLGIFEARPGITGLAQVRGIDMSTPELLAETDALMLRSLNLIEYLRYIAITIVGRGRGDRIGGMCSL